MGWSPHKKTDPKLQLIKESVIKKANLTKEDEDNQLKFEIKDGRLFRKQDGKLLWVVPFKIRWMILRRHHNDLGHHSIDKTIRAVLKNYWFAGMRRYVKGFIAACLDCLYYKTPSGSKPGLLNPIDKVGIPFHTLHMDHLGPFIRSSARNT